MEHSFENLSMAVQRDWFGSYETVDCQGNFQSCSNSFQCKQLYNRHVPLMKGSQKILNNRKKAMNMPEPRLIKVLDDKNYKAECMLSDCSPILEMEEEGGGESSYEEQKFDSVFKIEEINSHMVRCKIEKHGKSKEIPSFCYKTEGSVSCQKHNSVKFQLITQPPIHQIWRLAQNESYNTRLELHMDNRAPLPLQGCFNEKTENTFRTEESEMLPKVSTTLEQSSDIEALLLNAQAEEFEGTTLCQKSDSLVNIESLCETPFLSTGLPVPLSLKKGIVQTEDAKYEATISDKNSADSPQMETQNPQKEPYFSRSDKMWKNMQQNNPDIAANEYDNKDTNCNYVQETWSEYSGRGSLEEYFPVDDVTEACDNMWNYL